MDRKHFVRITGTSLCSLLFAKWTSAKSPENYLLHYPTKVFIKLDDGTFECHSSNKKEWSYKDVLIQLKEGNNVLQVLVVSPKSSLHHIQLQWDYKITEAAKILGDHWERTYGDVSFQPADFNKKLPWYLIQTNNRNTNCFGVKTGGNSICDWQIGNAKLQLTMDTRSAGVGVELGGRQLHAADIIATKTIGNENAFATANRFCGMMCTSPRLPKQPVYGINDWYFSYGKNSPELILEQTSMLASLATNTNNRPFSVVDAGWAAYSPLMPDDCCWQDDFSKPNAKFKDMAKLATDIKKLGMRPGLWTRPLCGSYKDKKSLLLPSIPGRNNPNCPVLDPTIEENIERIKQNVSLYNNWGFELVKHDFSTYDMLGKWGFQMKENITTNGWRFNDNSKTTAEIILHLYQSIRNAAGNMNLIGCNTLSHLSAGLFEINRIGDDTSGNEWERTKKMGVNTLAFRSVQNNKFYATDADCVGLTDKVPWTKNKQWMQLLAASGTPLFISAQPNVLGKEQKQFIEKCFDMAAMKMPSCEPLNWLDNSLPNKWKLNNEIVNFDWS